MTLIRPQVGLAFAFVSAENPPGTTSGKGGVEKKNRGGDDGKYYRPKNCRTSGEKGAAIFDGV